MRLVFLALLALALPASAEWRQAAPGWRYEFPADHGSHPDFKTEWWYFTGNLKAADGRSFGYQLTFFRQGVQPQGDDIIPLSRFVTRDVKFAHFALSELSHAKFHCFQKISRGAYGEAGFDAGEKLAWIDGWTCELLGDDGFRLKAQDGSVALDLELKPAKPLVIHGRDGVSAKAREEGKASHYYSFTRLKAKGTVQINGQAIPVDGLSWFDHEWASNQLGDNQVGWDWFSLQFEDGSELMAFQLRPKTAGQGGAFFSGTFVSADGTSTGLEEGDFQLTPSEPWKSPATGGEYPQVWKISAPKLALEVEVRAVMPEQELNFSPVRYWEGAVSAQGTRDGKVIKGAGFLEMTGYAGAVVGMKAEK